MRCYRCMHKAGLGLAILLLSTAAIAESYIGLGVGSASNDLKPLFGTQTLEDSPMAKVIIGVRTDNHAIELDISLGNFEWVGSNANSHTVVNVSFNLVGFMPVGDVLEVFGKLGGNMSSTAVEFGGTVYEGESGFGLSYGGGLIFNVSEDFSFRAEYQGLTGIDDGVDTGNIEWLSLQAVLDF